MRRGGSLEGSSCRVCFWGRYVQAVVLSTQVWEEVPQISWWVWVKEGTVMVEI